MAVARQVVAAAALATVVLAGVPAAAELKRPTLAIVGFRTAASGRTLPPPQLCDTAHQLTLDKLVASGEYHVYDGEWLAHGADSRRLSDEAAVRAAAVNAGVHYLAFGAITRFTTEVKDRGLGGAAFRVPLIGGGHRRRHELALSVSISIVDARTGEVVTTGVGTAIGSRTSVKLGGLASLGAGGFSRGSSDARDAQLDEALRHSIDLATRELIAAAPRLAAR